MSARTRYFVEAARRCSSAAAAARAASARITSAAQMRTSIVGAHATRWSSSTSSAFSVLTMQQLTGAGHAWSKPTFMLTAAGAAMLVGAGATMHSESQTQASPATSQRLFCWGTLSPPEAAGAAVPRARKEAVVVDFFSERGLGLSQLSFGSAHAAALDATGGVWVWGTQAGPAPQKLQTASLGQIAQLASTSDCLYAVTKSGKVHAWRDLDAQLVARGAAEVTSEPVLGEIAKVEAESMAAGADHCLVISKEGEVYAFGSNSHGQLGLGKSASELARADAPTKLGPLPAKAVQAACGDAHSLVALADGRCVSFGDDLNLQLGLRSTSVKEMRGGAKQVPTPTLVNAFVGRRVSAVAAGGGGIEGGHSAFLLEKENGGNELWTCGHGRWGQTGLKKYKHISEPTPVSTLGSLMEWSEEESRNRPIRVVQVGCGERHTAVLLETGNIFIWGWNESGQLGNGGAQGNPTPAMMKTPAVLRFTHLRHMACGPNSMAAWD